MPLYMSKHERRKDHINHMEWKLRDKIKRKKKLRNENEKNPNLDGIICNWIKR